MSYATFRMTLSAEPSIDQTGDHTQPHLMQVQLSTPTGGYMEIVTPDPTIVSLFRDMKKGVEYEVILNRVERRGG